jgi:FixJ family two-component response regulator
MEKKIKNRVLIVDDDISVLAALKRGLRKEPYEKIYVDSGFAALEVLEEKEISILVTDMRMPKMTGLQLLKEVKEKYPKVVRIVLSGYTQIAQLIATINNGDIYRFIAKPWQLEAEFIPIIREAIEYYNERLQKQEAFEKYKEAYIEIQGEGVLGERRMQMIRKPEELMALRGGKDDVLLNFSKMTTEKLIDLFYECMQKGMLSFKKDRVLFIKELTKELFKSLISFSIIEEMPFNPKELGNFEKITIPFMEKREYNFELYGNIRMLNFLYLKIMEASEHFSKNGNPAYGIRIEESEKTVEVHFISRFPNADLIQKTFIEMVFKMIDQVVKIFGGYVILHFLQGYVYVDFNMPLFKFEERNKEKNKGKNTKTFESLFKDKA